VTSLFSQKVIEKDSLSKYTFDELSDKFYAAKPDSLKAILYAKYHIDKAKREKDTIQLGKAYYKLSNITSDSTYFVGYWKQILSLKNTNPNLKVIGNLDLGDFYLQQGSKEKALVNYLNSNDLITIKVEDSLKATSIYRLGMIKQYNKNYDEAIQHILLGIGNKF
jgi:hypothetical protein